jgi:biopolymer transport protein ExbD
MSDAALASEDLFESSFSVGGGDKHDDAEFDITAMIDLVFMMNIYFLVTFITTAMSDIDLPAANRCAPLDGDTAITFTVESGKEFGTVSVTCSDVESQTPWTEPQEQEDEIAKAVQAAAAAGKTAVLIKAERTIRLKEIARLSLAARQEGMSLHLAVREKDLEP